MKKVDIEKIKAELEKGFGKTCMRYGIEYAWYNAGALDEGIKTRARNAKKWREKLVELSESGELTEERVVVCYDGLKRFKYKVTAYYVDGELAVYRKGSKLLDIENYERI